MKAVSFCRILLLVAACIAIVSIGACARTGMDGGIVGTGNRIDCASQEKSQDCEKPRP